jgi:1-acyl-sn-glycerol-3-phosphate acyltransferase
MPDSVDSTALQHSRTPMWRNVSFTLMWTSTAASGFGDRMIMLAALALLGGLGKTADSAGVQASTQFFFFLPYLVFNVIGGWLADHLPRKWLLLFCDESRGMVLLGSFLMLLSMSGDAALPVDHHWRVFAALAAIGTFAAIFNPTRNAIVPQIVPIRQLQSANAVILVINVAASMVGMVVGTQLIINPNDVATVRTGLLMGAVFYLVSGTFFAFMNPAHSIRSATARRRSLRQAARYANTHRRVLMLIAVNTMVWCAAAVVSTGVMGVLKIHYALEGETLFGKFGILSALMGTGMLFGAAAVILIGTRRESTIVLSFGLILAGTCTLILAAVPWWPVTYASAFCIGLFGNIAIISAITVLQAICPNYIRGRMMGLNAMINTIFSVCVYAIIWLIPESDYWVLVIMLVLGPMLMACGLTAMIRHLRSGPMPNKMANFFWRIGRLFCFSWHGLTVRGKHHVPSDGPVVIAANHTTAMDPFLIQSACTRMVRWLMLTSYRMKIGNPLWNAIDPICIEHDLSTGEQKSAMKQVRQIVTELKKGDLVGMFPEGRLQYDDRELEPFQDGAAAVARLSSAAIVPCWVHGTVLSKSMLAHVFKPTQSSVTFGEPFVPERGQSAEEITAEIRRRIVALSQPQKAAWCQACGYDLRGNPKAEHCPECGERIGTV